MNGRPEKHSLTLKGHRTSVSLEADFWRAFREIAAERGLPLNEGISRPRSRAVGVSPAKRISGCQGRTKRIGQEMCGMATSSVSRSSSASRTRRNSKYSR